MIATLKAPISDASVPSQIRVSIGSAIVLGLLEGKLDSKPSTTYLMTYTKNKCVANCGFCSQARNSQSKAELLSRVTWPVFSTQMVIGQIVNSANLSGISRVCFQALNYPSVFNDIAAMVKAIKQQTDVPISVSCQPINANNMKLLKHAGVERIGIGIDAATQKIFDKIKGSGVEGPYRWMEQFRHLKKATAIFGLGNVSAHLIIGLGETEKEATHFIQNCKNQYILPALFAFTPIIGTALALNPKPSIETYRRLQLIRHLIVKELSQAEKMKFDKKGRVVDFGVNKETLIKIVETGQPFLTSGCPDCNRPFYNEKPSGPLYNYPKKLLLEDILAIKNQLKLN